MKITISLSFFLFFLTAYFIYNSDNSNIKTQLDVFYTVEMDTLQSLDIFWNDKSENSDIILFVHGGGWLSGDKKAYRNMASNMAGQGLTVILVNYRLSPQVKFPKHVEDVAASILWTIENAKDYNSDPQKIFLMGHSAGAHIISLLTFDGQYLNKLNVNSNAIAGLITISGVFEIKIQKGGATKKYLEMVFGTEEIWKEASCQTHIDKSKNSLPPILITWVKGENDLIKNESLGLINVFENAAVKYRSYIFEGKNHNSFLADLQNSNSSFSRELSEFIRISSH